MPNACDCDGGKNEWCKNQYGEHCDNKPGPAICEVDCVADTESLGHKERRIFAVEIKDPAFPRALGNGFAASRRQVNEVRQYSDQRNHADEDPHEPDWNRIEIRARHEDRR